MAAIDNTTLTDQAEAASEAVHKENIALREEVDGASMFEEIVGACDALRAVLSRVSKVAPTAPTILITGETCTGKELIARAVRSLLRTMSSFRHSCTGLRQLELLHQSNNKMLKIRDRPTKNCWSSL